MRTLLVSFLLLTHVSSAYSLVAGDDLVKTWKNKQEAYYKGESLVEENSRLAVAKLRELLSEYKWSKERKVPMLHRLAELELNLGRIAENASDSSSMSSHTRKALNLFHGLSKSYPNYKRRDKVLFTYGFELYMRNKYKDAYYVLKKVTDHHKNSRYLGDSYLIQADSQFELENYSLATKLYNSVIGSSHTELIAYSKYRKSWALYNLKKYNSAFDSLTDLLIGQNYDNSQFQTTKKEALNDLPLFYSRQTGRFSPYSDFSKFYSRKEMETALNELGGIYDSRGLWNKSIKTYTLLIANYSRSQNISLYHMKKGMSLSTKNNIIPAGQSLAKGLNLCKTQDCQKFANSEVFDLVNDWEKYWRKHQKDENYLSSLKTVYPPLAKVAKDKKERAKIYLLLAELHYYSKEYIAASRSYENSYRSHPESSFAKQAHWGSVHSLMQLDKKSWKRVDVERLKSLTVHYVSNNPADSKAIDAQNFVADVYKDRGQLEQAAELYAHISFKYRNTKAGISAYNSYIALKAKKEDYKDVAVFLLKMRKTEKNNKRLQTINADVDKAFEEWSQKLINEKDTTLAARVLEKALKYRGSSELAPNWMWNRALSLFESDAYSYAAKEFILYVNKYGNKYGKKIEALENALVSYREVNRYKNSLKVVNMLLRVDGKRQDHWLSQKFEVLYELGDYIKAYHSLAQMSEKSEKKDQLFLSLIDKIDASTIDQILRTNLSGFSPETVGELYVKTIDEIDDISDKRTNEIAIRLTKLGASDTNYQAKGHYYIALYKSQKFISDEGLEVTTNAKGSMEQIVQRVLPIDDHFRAAIELSGNEVQVRSLLSMGQIYTEAAYKFKGYIEKLAEKNYDISEIKTMVKPFIEQSQTFLKEAKTTAQTLNYSDRDASIRRAAKRNKRFLEFLNESSKPVVISKRDR